MPKGMFLIGWDDRLGSVIEAKYPPESEVSENLLLQFLVSIQNAGSCRTVQIQDENHTVLVLGALPQQAGSTRAFNYDFIVIILDDTETANIGKFRAKLKLDGEKIILASKSAKQELFLNFARQFFEPPINKIVFMGFPNAGKTSTKMFVFEKAREELLLNTPLEPTLGFEASNYNFFDMNISLFDTSGQELDRWLDQNEGVLIAADLVVFFFSVQDWTEQQGEVQNYITRLNAVAQENENASMSIIAFCHKSDQIQGNPEDFKNDVQAFLQTLQIPVFFTSIVDGGNQDLIIGTQLILEKFSVFFSSFNERVIPLLKRFNFHPLLIADKYKRIVANFHLNESEFQQIKPFYLALLQIQEGELQEPLNFLATWLTDRNYCLICVSLANFYPDLANLLIRAESLEKISDFAAAYQELMDSFQWKAENIDLAGV